MMRRIIHTLIWTLALTGLALLLIASAEKYSQLPCGEITVSTSMVQGFIKPDALKEYISSKFEINTGQSLDPKKLRMIKQYIEGMPHVEKAAVFRTIDGGLNIHAIQREPLLRIRPDNGQDYYLDSSGFPFPVSRVYTARVTVVTGSRLPDYARAKTDYDPWLGNYSNHDVLNEVLTLGRYIHENEFWQAYISQIHTTARSSFELIPTNGAHIIEFGPTHRMEEKFDKLMRFYRHGLTRVGWNQYKRINVNYRNQVVCSK